MFVEIPFRDFAGGLAFDAYASDALHGEAAQGVSLVAPGIEVPAVAVMGEALRGDRASCFGVAAAGVVADAKTTAFDQRVGAGSEMFAGVAGRHAENADASFELALACRMPAQKPVDLLAQGFKFGVQQT